MDERMADRRDTVAAAVPDIRRFALIIGAMKSGTTSLFEYLAAHPQVAPCSVKEPNFFSDRSFWDRGTDAYRRLWDWRPDVHRVALEASTAYTKSPAMGGVPERIREVDGQFRFLYIMRDPIERISSHLTHTAIDRGGSAHVGEEDFRWALMVSRYATQLAVYARHWPRDAILPLVYEGLAAEPGLTVRRALEFLDVSPDPMDVSVLERIHNTRVDLAAGLTVSRVVGSTALESLRRWIPAPVIRPLRRLVGRWKLQEVGLTGEQRARAVRALRPEVERLRTEWGVDTSYWDPSLTAGSDAE